MHFKSATAQSFALRIFETKRPFKELATEGKGNQIWLLFENTKITCRFCTKSTSGNNTNLLCYCSVIKSLWADRRFSRDQGWARTRRTGLFLPSSWRHDPIVPFCERLSSGLGGWISLMIMNNYTSTYFSQNALTTFAGISVTHWTNKCRERMDARSCPTLIDFSFPLTD